MIRQFFAVVILVATLCVSSASAQVPEGGAYTNEAVTVDNVVLELLSHQPVLAQLNAASGRHGLKLEKILRSQEAMHAATYTFVFGSGRDGDMGLMTSARFNVEVSFGPTGKVLVSRVGKLSVAH